MSPSANTTFDLIRSMVKTDRAEIDEIWVYDIL